MFRLDLARAREAGGQRGFTILESLVTVVILAFGVLGLVGLQSKMQLAEVESYQRSQALVLLENIAARLNANRGNAATYAAYVVSKGPVGTDDSEPDLSGCSAKAIGLQRDICEWSNALKGNAEQVAGNSAGTMTGGRGCIEQIVGAYPPSFLVTVAWQGMHRTVAPSLACAEGSYGADEYRRAISKVVTIANLTPP